MDDIDNLIADQAVAADGTFSYDDGLSPYKEQKDEA